MVAIANNGQLLGVRGPTKKTGRYFWPAHLSLGGTGYALTVTASRYYIVPFYVDKPTTFAGAWTQNTSAGDTGFKIKIAAYSEAAAGGPGAIAKDFGEVTLTAAAALRNFASSWTAPAGWYWLELTSDSATTLYAYLASVTSAGNWTPQPSDQIGTLDAPVVGGLGVLTPIGDYVGGTYANFPEATSLTPTNTIRANNASGTFPVFGLYT
jgi:hypothetical protein